MSSKFSPIQRRLRNSARIALYGSLTLTLGLGAGLLPLSRSSIEAAFDSSWYGTDFASDPSVKRLQDLLRIDTTPTGDEQAAADYLAEVLGDAGLEVHIERMPDQKANLWAILEGDDPSALVLHSHLDTEPIFDESAWRYPPFSATIEKPWIYGRGAFDMKSVTAAQIEVVLEVARRAKQENRRPRRSLIFLATSSEEVGSEIGALRIVEEHPELVRRFWAVITEGGVIEARDRGEIKYWGTSFGQKRFHQVWACGSNRQRLEDFVTDMRSFGVSLPPSSIPPEVRTFLASYALSRDDPRHRRVLTDPDQVLRDYSAFELLPPYLRALFRNEAAVFPVEELADGSFRVRVSLHILPGADAEQAKRDLLPEFITHGLDIRHVEPRTAERGSPWPHPITEAIERSILKRHGDVPQGPYFLAFYANDSRFFRRAGVASYGFSPFAVMVSDSLSLGRANERLALPEYLDGVSLYADVVLPLVGFDTPHDESPGLQVLTSTR